MTILFAKPIAAGVIGPAASTDNAVARYDGTTGMVIQNSGVYITDDGRVGINTDSPDAPLEIKSDIYPQAIISANSDQSAALDFASAGHANSRQWRWVSAKSTGSFQIVDVDASEYRLTVDDEGSIGIGTTTPEYLLHVAGGTTQTLNLRVQSEAHLADIRPITNSIFVENVGGSDIGHMSSAGDNEFNWYGNTYLASASGGVGINNTSPLAKLDIAASPRWDDSTADPAFVLRSSIVGEEAKHLRMGFDSLGGNNIGFIQSAETAVSTHPLVLNAQGGHVGIGTNNPAAKLDVVGGDIYLGNVGTVTALKFARHLDGAYLAGLRLDTDDDITVGSSSFDNLRFDVKNVANAMFIENNTGQVGIGTTSPTNHLHIHDSGTGSGDHAFIHFTTGDTGETSTDGMTVGYTADEQGVVGVRENSPLVFYTNGSANVRMTILESGQVGIGTIAPNDKLEVNGNIRVFSDGNDPQVIIGDDVNNFLRLAYDSSANKSWINSYGGGVESDLFMQVGAGKLGLGTTSPTAKFEIFNNAEGLVSKFFGGNADGIRLTSYIHDVDGYAALYAYDEDDGGSPGFVKTQIGQLDYSALTVDGLQGRIGINQASPTAKLHIVGSEDIEQLLVQSNSTQNDDVAKYGDVSAGNYLAVEDDGTLRLNGDARVYNDIQFSLATAKVPAVNAPTWATFTANTNKYTFDINDYVDLEANELPHSYAVGTNVEWHVHIYNNGLDGTDRTVKYIIHYCITNVNGVITEANVSQQITIPANTTDKTHLYFDIGGAIDGSGFNFGADITARIERIATDSGSDPSGDPFVSMVGLHAKDDTMGSRTETTK